jgi:biotin transport system substrate-specific component
MQEGFFIMSDNKKTKGFTTKDIVYIGIFAAIMAICSWISIPLAVPVTLQTFGVFLAVGILGGKRGTIAVTVFVLLGAVGVPVFSGFNGGLGYLMGATGGYIIGFIASALLMWLLEKVIGIKMWAMGVSMVLGLLVCYAFGTIWFMQVYSANKGAIDLMTALTWCVFPFIIPDVIKIACALVLSNRLRKVLNNM